MSATVPAVIDSQVQRRVGTVIDGKYQLIGVLGTGAAGAVYSASVVPSKRLVAVKVLHPRFENDPQVVERFTREAFAPNRVRLGDAPHPNVMVTLDAGRAEGAGCFYMVQRLLAGEPLEAYLARQPARRVPLTDTVAVMRPVIDAIAAAHEAGVVHRDLKPANVFLVGGSALQNRTAVKVLDFGIAQYADKRITVGDTLLGTPQYMSPESFMTPNEVDARVDVWSLGVILYEMLSGVQPFDLPGAHWITVALNVRNGAPPPLEAGDAPPALVAVVARCLAKDREARWPDARALQDAMEAAVGV